LWGLIVGSELRTIGSLHVSNYLMVVINLCMVHKLWLMHHNFCCYACVCRIKFLVKLRLEEARLQKALFD